MIFNMTGGGSNPLNFQVKTYPSETELKADNPKENTIGVITTTTMTSWVFSATEPTEPEVGMVWIVVGTSSAADFNAIKKNTLQVYPLFAKQYVNGAWVEIEARSYQNGKWVKWYVYLYKDGNQFTDITGGWNAINSPVYEISFDQDGIHGTNNGGSGAWNASAFTKNKIDVTNCSNLTLEIDAVLDYEGGSLYVGLSTQNTASPYFGDFVAFEEITNTGKYSVTVPLDNVIGQYYVGICTQYILFTANDFALS